MSTATEDVLIPAKMVELRAYADKPINIGWGPAAADGPAESRADHHGAAMFSTYFTQDGRVQLQGMVGESPNNPAARLVGFDLFISPAEATLLADDLKRAAQRALEIMPAPADPLDLDIPC